MNQIQVSPLLRFALRLDGIGSFLAGVLTCVWQAPLAAMVGTSLLPVQAIGLFMLAYGLLISWLSTRLTLVKPVVWVLVIGNFLWAIDSVWLAWSGLITPSSAGVLLLLVQAGLVAVFAQLQYLGLQRSPGLQPA